MSKARPTEPIKDRLLAHGIGFSLFHTATPLPSDGEKFRWHCTLVWGNQRMWEGGYFKGSGHAIEVKRADGKRFKKAPGVSLDDLLEALHNDATAWESNPVFEDFCRDMGYSEDSIKALEIHNGCRKAYVALRNIPHLYDLLGEIMEEL